MSKVRPDRSALRVRLRPPSGALALTLQVAFLLFTGLSAKAQTFTVLHTFTGKGDGKYPSAGLLRDNAGNLYSTTSEGGSFDYGTVFEIKGQAKETVLHSFWSGDGWLSISTLIRDKAGNLYGTSEEGGTPRGGGCLHGCGTAFKLDIAGKQTVLHAFTGGKDGSQPETGLVLDGPGNLYGTTTKGGDLSCRYGNGCGVVFKVNNNGEETVVYTFTGKPDGWWPTGGLIRDKAGNLYGITWFGGVSDLGTVFMLDPAGNETILYSFGGTDGKYPNGPLVRDAMGNFYGTTTEGGELPCDCGVVFKLDKNGKETVLHAFTGGTDGALPYVGLTRDRAGNLYGVTLEGGGSTACYGGCGTVFKVDPNKNETVLYSFTGASDGSSPVGLLVLDKTGSLYGTANGGGDLSCGYEPAGCGVVFKLKP